eukprot:CAMPEP_0172531586 /NCGR_PEP_ID=MMETSP1067-20121228/4936_1 /TAXON_ID=265564 ORGANISM="Thalassiosira punctigera, Strain Tpunct2005C2" /NCGR_SAMPLE_ID=MMETSP1067 /ASSEMBLY_ACC=CAM_ASM_000444 /LENGTH=789 /DNA_ID=CAMNT_0013315983 /DNA_START=174 /DNA_END=2543 /DNA_ORIENTATION=+
MNSRWGIRNEEEDDDEDEDDDDGELGDLIYNSSHTARVRAAEAVPSSHANWKRKHDDRQSDGSLDPLGKEAIPDAAPSSNGAVDFGRGQNDPHLKRRKTRVDEDDHDEPEIAELFLPPRELLGHADEATCILDSVKPPSIVADFGGQNRSDGSPKQNEDSIARIHGKEAGEARPSDGADVGAGQNRHDSSRKRSEGRAIDSTSEATEIAEPLRRSSLRDDYLQSLKGGGAPHIFHAAGPRIMDVADQEGSEKRREERPTVERRMGVWSKAEHSRFEEGLLVHGWGNWRPVRDKFVTTRTCDQISNHARGYQWLRERNEPSKVKIWGTWSQGEHSRFKEGIVAHGWGHWRSIRDEFVPTRSCQQISTHARAYQRGHPVEFEALESRHDELSEEPSGAGWGPWTKAERSRFEEGIAAHGWGDWGSIRREFVPDRSTKQIRDHAIEFRRRRGAKCEALERRREEERRESLRSTERPSGDAAAEALGAVGGAARLEGSSGERAACKGGKGGYIAATDLTTRDGPIPTGEWATCKGGKGGYITAIDLTTTDEPVPAGEWATCKGGKGGYITAIDLTTTDGPVPAPRRTLVTAGAINLWTSPATTNLQNFAIAQFMMQNAMLNPKATGGMLKTDFNRKQRTTTQDALADPEATRAATTNTNPVQGRITQNGTPSSESTKATTTRPDRPVGPSGEETVGEGRGGDAVARRRRQRLRALYGGRRGKGDRLVAIDDDGPQGEGAAAGGGPEMGSDDGPSSHRMTMAARAIDQWTGPATDPQNFAMAQFILQKGMGAPT